MANDTLRKYVEEIGSFHDCVTTGGAYYREVDEVVELKTKICIAGLTRDEHRIDSRLNLDPDLFFMVSPLENKATSREEADDLYRFLAEESAFRNNVDYVCNKRKGVSYFTYRADQPSKTLQNVLCLQRLTGVDSTYNDPRDGLHSAFPVYRELMKVGAPQMAAYLLAHLFKASSINNPYPIVQGSGVSHTVFCVDKLSPKTLKLLLEGQMWRDNSPKASEQGVFGWGGTKKENGNKRLLDPDLYNPFMFNKSEVKTPLQLFWKPKLDRCDKIIRLENEKELKIMLDQWLDWIYNYE